MIYIEIMEKSPTHGFPPEFLSELESKYFWWEPVGLEPRSAARIIAQAMSLASFEDVRRLEQILGHDRLADIMLNAGPGWIDERSWEFWRGRLMQGTALKIPEGAPRRSFDVESA
jgi:hypothetical protein